MEIVSGDPNDVLNDEMKVMEVVDQEVYGLVGVVVLTSGDGSGRVLYDAACLLKSVIRDRVFLLKKMQIMLTGLGERGSQAGDIQR